MRVTLDMIPFGYNNRITKETLVSLTGQSERAVREQIAELACSHPICASSKWAGVFRPLPGERSYVKTCLEETKSRGKKVFERIGAYDRFLQEDIQPTLGF